MFERSFPARARALNFAPAKLSASRIKRKPCSGACASGFGAQSLLLFPLLPTSVTRARQNPGFPCKKMHRRRNSILAQSRPLGRKLSKNLPGVCKNLPNSGPDLGPGFRPRISRRIPAPLKKSIRRTRIRSPNRDRNPGPEPGLRPGNFSQEPKKNWARISVRFRARIAVCRLARLSPNCLCQSKS